MLCRPRKIRSSQATCCTYAKQGAERRPDFGQADERNGTGGLRAVLGGRCLRRFVVYLLSCRLDSTRNSISRCSLHRPARLGAQPAASVVEREFSPRVAKPWACCRTAARRVPFVALNWVRVVDENIKNFREIKQHEQQEGAPSHATISVRQLGGSRRHCCSCTSTPHNLRCRRTPSRTSKGNNFSG